MAFSNHAYAIRAALAVCAALGCFACGGSVVLITDSGASAVASSGNLLGDSGGTPSSESGDAGASVGTLSELDGSYDSNFGNPPEAASADDADTYDALPRCGVSPFTSGVWILLTNVAASTIEPARNKQYLYVASNEHWYLSPVTSLTWAWNSYQAQSGIYTYCDGVTVGSFACTSRETGEFGVGCSNGPGGTFKTLPIYSATSTVGQCEVCQDQPDAFGGAVCETGISIYVRYVP